MTCSICKKPIEHAFQVTYDHVIPLARGGAHTEENLRPAHQSCNAWKGDRLPEELVGKSPPEPGDVDVELRRIAAINAAKSASHKARIAALTEEEEAERRAKIAAGVTPEVIAKRSAAVAAAWANKTPEEREAWRARCREVKRGSKGNLENLKKGWDPEVRAKAIELSAEQRRGKPVSEEQKAKTSESLKRAYGEGRKLRDHSEATKMKISETKRSRRKRAPITI